MFPTKAQVASIAYNAIHEHTGALMSYENKLRFVIDVIRILKDMAETEYAQLIDSNPHEEEEVVE